MPLPRSILLIICFFPSPVANVPAKAQTAALPVYSWDDEAGKNIDMYGYGKTGRAAKLWTVSALTSYPRIGKFLACTRMYNSSRISLCHRMDIYICIICSQKQKTITPTPTPPGENLFSGNAKGVGEKSLPSRPEQNHECVRGHTQLQNGLYIATTERLGGAV